MLLVGCGIRKVRLTGGEPLVRKNIITLVEKLAAAAGVKELTMTTNGVLLETMAGDLKAAGLERVNISVDSLDRERYRLITGSDLLEKVNKGIHKAMEVGLTPVKINTVVLKGINERDVTALAQLTVEMPVAVRFIECYPTNAHVKPDRFFLPNMQVRKYIESKFGSLAAAVAPNANGPSVYFKIKNSPGYVGFISGRSTFFCSSCNRLRLTSDGKIKPCLYSDHDYDVRELIRAGAGNNELQNLMRKIIREKPGYTRLNSFTDGPVMCSVGG